MPRAKKGQQKVLILKKTTGLCPCWSYDSICPHLNYIPDRQSRAGSSWMGWRATNWTWSGAAGCWGASTLSNHWQGLGGSTWELREARTGAWTSGQAGDSKEFPWWRFFTESKPRCPDARLKFREMMSMNSFNFFLVTILHQLKPKCEIL